MGFIGKRILKNIYSIIAGVIITLIIIIPISLVALLMGFSDTSIPKSQEVFSNLLLYGTILLGSAVGGYTTSTICTSRNIRFGLITGSCLTILLAIINNFEFDWRVKEMGIFYFLIVPAALVGVLIDTKKKPENTLLYFRLFHNNFAI